MIPNLRAHSPPACDHWDRIHLTVPQHLRIDQELVRRSALKATLIYRVEASLNAVVLYHLQDLIVRPARLQQDLTCWRLQLGVEVGKHANQSIKTQVGRC